MAANAVAAAPAADAEGRPAQPDPGELRLADKDLQNYGMYLVNC